MPPDGNQLFAQLFGKEKKLSEFLRCYNIIVETELEIFNSGQSNFIDRLFIDLESHNAETFIMKKRINYQINLFSIFKHIKGYYRSNVDSSFMEIIATIAKKLQNNLLLKIYEDNMFNTQLDSKIEVVLSDEPTKFNILKLYLYLETLDKIQ